MAFIEDMQVVMKSDELQSKSIKFFENVIKAATGNKFAAKDAFEFIISSPGLIRDYLFWEKFKLFLNGVFIENDDVRKLSEVFTENEDRIEYAKRVIKTIDDLETDSKIKSMINLTRALLSKFIEKTEYYRLCNALRNTFQEDLQFLKENIDKQILKENIHIEFLSQNGLVRQTVIDSNGNNEFEFTHLAYMLVKYGLDYENESKYKYSSDKPDRLNDYNIKPTRATQSIKVIR